VGVAENPRRGARIPAQRPLSTPTSQQLLALQLHARGYSAEQIGRLVNQPPAGVAALLARAAEHLGAPDVQSAVSTALHLTLIV
jgi:hypothetical protein